MANKFGLGSLPLESKNPMTTFINKAKPFFVDQIGDTLQGDIDMNNFKITKLKFPGNDNDAVNKKYLPDQINAIQIDKDHVENRITDVKRFIRRNIKNLVDEPKLQQELTSLKRLIQVDKTRKIILMKDNFQEIKRPRVGRGGTDLLKKINEYEGENCYIPTDGHCFIKCVNRVLNKDLTYLKPTDPIPEEFYDKLMNVVEIFVGTDCIDQMLKYLGQYDRKRLTLISHNGSGFDNWIVLKNAKKLTHYPLKTPRGILSFPLSNPYTDEDLQKKWKRQKEIKGNYLQHINFTCFYQHESSSLAAWGNSSNLPANLRKIADVDIAKYTRDNWEELRHEWEPYAKRDTLCLGACLIKYNQFCKPKYVQ
ncbi:hypothetical protein LOTGIDRAFT_158455 [Lottia gigantea]|uniref:DNA-directed DNA polymerase n=1 Tax=Lottia gigantea TaxID=225164 RepID=V4A653_LOTGI|nr:hypothetical protein LOTGIDRAFT_158455 [Lottia gigantea]ESO99368.1 hypothetical protein LOTGIDRAFT_158455 [Lottia gigantea]